MAWQLLESNVVYSNPWFDVRNDVVLRPDGVPDSFAHIIAPGSVTVLALHEDDSVVLTRQWVYIHGGTEWRLPAGVVRPADADPGAAARRELAEETGLAASSWHKIGVIHGADSVSNHVDHLFLATGLSPAPTRPDSTKSTFAVRRLPFADTLTLIRNGQLPHAGSGHALLLTALERAADVA